MNERWKYYLLTDGRGGPYEIYRLLDDGRPFYEALVPKNLYLARKSGEWSNYSEDIRGFLNASLSGDMVPGEDEIPEEEALSLLKQWRTVGPWPGRPW